MRINLQWKLTLIIFAVIFFVLAVSYYLINHNLQNYLEQRIHYNLKRDLILGKDILENESFISSRETNMGPVSSRIGKSLNLRATIVGQDGRVLGDSALDEKEVLGIENHILRPEIQAAAKNGFGLSKRFSATQNTSMLYMAMPFTRGSEKGFLRLSMPLYEVQAVMSKGKKIIVAAMFFSLIPALILGTLISFMISRPLREMSAVARGLAKGDFSRKIYNRSRDEVGDLALALNYMTTEIKNKMSKISYEEAKLNGVISSMFEGVILTDENGHIIMMNPSLRKLFLIEDAPEGKKPIEAMRNNRIQDIVEDIIRDGKRVSTEETLVRSHEEVVLKINGAPVIKNDHLEGVILVFHDISELRNLERIRRDFVANVSHELRTPLANIKGYAETLLDGALNDTAHARDFTGIIYRESDRLARLIEDLLDLSKIESGRMKMTIMPVDIARLVNRVSEVMKKFLRDKNITLNVSTPQDIPYVSADDSRLAQVILNLLDNAIKFTPENGSVNITISKKNPFVRVEISDTGTGIPEKDLPRIFERFYRVDKGRSRGLGGTGLGLSIVKHIVQSHGGEVSVTSKTGNGSTFAFTIPMSKT